MKKVKNKEHIKSSTNTIPYFETELNISNNKLIKKLIQYVPDTPSLIKGLTSIFNSKIKIINREFNIYTTSSPSEIITCIVNNGKKIRLLCKYSGPRYKIQDHRNGVAYEAKVYQQILLPLHISVPKFYGIHKNNFSKWLIIRYLGKEVRLHSTLSVLTNIKMAAKLIGQFHASYDNRIKNIETSFLKEYDFKYYVGWARRTATFAGLLHQDYPWLKTLCKAYEEAVRSLLTQQKTIIHGEYYTDNIIVQNKTIYIIDWETAALAMGEIDLAFLTDDWPKKITRQCENEYKKARWAHNSPADFKKNLNLARLYIHFRWLGDNQKLTDDVKESQWRFKQLYAIGKRLKLI